MNKQNDVRAAMHALVGTSGEDIQNAYGMQGDWCMMTIWVGFQNAGAPECLCGGEKTAWVPTCWEYYQSRGMTGTEPQAGALTFFDYNGNGTPDHIEYCDGSNGEGTFNDISGNSGQDYVFAECVGMSGVLGFAYPDYGTEETITNTQEEQKMQFIFRPNKENYLAYYDGTKVHPLHHPDEVTAINMCYRQCFGRDIPIFEFGVPEAPWASRFMEAVSR